MSSNSVCNHTRDWQIGLPLRSRPATLERNKVYWSWPSLLHAQGQRGLHPNNINRDSGIEIPEAWMLTIKKHNNRRAVRQRTAEEANRWVNSKDRNAPIGAVEWQLITTEHHEYGLYNHAWPVDLIAWRRIAVCSRNVAIYITRDYIVRQTKNLAFIVRFC